MTLRPAVSLVFLGIVLIPSLLACIYLAWQSPGRRIAWGRRAVLVLLVTVIALVPSTPIERTTVSGVGLDIFFVVDRTGSMAAEDWGPNPDIDPEANNGLEANRRLDGVKHDINRIVDDLPGARYSIITFDSGSTRQLPLTWDARAVKSWTETLKQEITFYSVGSSLDRPLDRLRTTLAQAQERSPESVRVLFYLSDGEQLSNEPVLSFAELAPYLSGGGVLGYGTSGGGPMRVWDGATPIGPDTPYIQDFSQSGYPQAISYIDEANLRTIAEELGVNYHHRTGPDSTRSVTNGIDADEVIRDVARTVSTWRAWVWPFALGVGALLIWELWSIGATTKPRRVRFAGPGGRADVGKKK